jgi:GST-like protein
MACWPWIVPYKNQGQKLEDFPNVQRWFGALKARPALERGYVLGRDLRTPGMDAEAKKVLFGQTAR